MVKKAPPKMIVLASRSVLLLSSFLSLYLAFIPAISIHNEKTMAIILKILVFIIFNSKIHTHYICFAYLLFFKVALLFAYFLTVLPILLNAVPYPPIFLGT